MSKKCSYINIFQGPHQYSTHLVFNHNLLHHLIIGPMNEEDAVLVHRLQKENVWVNEPISTHELKRKNTMTVILMKCVVGKVSDRHLVGVMLVLAAVIADPLEITMITFSAVTTTD